MARSSDMVRTWLSIRVELVSGRGEQLWPRPGRAFAAARSHTFFQLADAIDTAFARWDRAHVHRFELSGGRLIGRDDSDPRCVDDGGTSLSTLGLGEQFLYDFDFGDSWTHLCTVGPARIDPEAELGVLPQAPLPYWGWGTIPDQYGRRWEGDDGEGPEPPNPGLAELPPFRPWWEPQGR